ncbi:sigma-54-dependent transcriptional regulator, partial [candidate division KSB1 bacterium]
MISNILVVDDEKKICNILSKILSDEGYEVKAAGSGEEAVEVVDSYQPDLIVMDQNMPGIDGVEAMSQIREKYPDSTIIIITAYGSIPLAVDAMKKGAYDYISKPFDNDELLLVIKRAIERKKLTEEISRLKEQLREKFSFKNIIGVSTKMHTVFEQMCKVGDTDATVLIQGESGTGKELVASAIHYSSNRKDKPFVAVNCGAVPVNLIESEFFGHEKGAFTDAREKKIGKFEHAHCGTIFLDEVGELPMDAQVKLLRVLDEMKITRIGGNELIPVDVRVIAATNINLQQAVDEGKFRLDLFYRLNIFAITLPPLRERKEDIPLLVEHFIDKHNKNLGKNINSISRLAVNCLENYSWRGNVRDLENAIQSAMILTKGEVISLEDLPMRIRGYPELTEDKEIDKKGLE